MWNHEHSFLSRARRRDHQRPRSSPHGEVGRRIVQWVAGGKARRWVLQAGTMVIDGRCRGVGSGDVNAGNPELCLGLPYQRECNESNAFEVSSSDALYQREYNATLNFRTCLGLPYPHVGRQSVAFRSMHSAVTSTRGVYMPVRPIQAETGTRTGPPPHPVLTVHARPWREPQARNPQ
jgi:hypothetical protein